MMSIQKNQSKIIFAVIVILTATLAIAPALASANVLAFPGEKGKGHTTSDCTTTTTYSGQSNHVKDTTTTCT